MDNFEIGSVHFSIKLEICELDFKTIYKNKLIFIKKEVILEFREVVKAWMIF